MPKPTVKNGQKPEIIDQVIQRVRAKKTSKKARNLSLNVENWKVFETLCKQDEVWPSEVLDEFITLYIQRRADKAEQVSEELR